MVKYGPAGMRACSLGLVGLGFRDRDKVRVSVRVSDGVRVSTCLLYTSPSPRDRQKSRMPSSA